MMETPREPHSVSLKVLRLSRPSFSQQFPLPLQPKELNSQTISKPRTSPSSGKVDDKFIIGPLLTLPPAFGSAYVGEIFSCTLSANNELEAGAEKLVTSVKMAAEMQAPSVKIPLDLMPVDQDASPPQIDPGESMQKILRFELREEGNHVLAVSLSYSETTMSKENSASSGRVRTFRKLYQFVAQPCLSVRTKVSDLPSGNVDGERSKSPKNQRFALEAQLENMADGPITLEKVTFNPKPPFRSTSINWDAGLSNPEHVDSPILALRDVMQVAFLVEQYDDQRSSPLRDIIKDGRAVLGQLNIQWRTAMGDVGSLSTGWLMTRRR